ncbi:hypothetical protein [Botrimarina sp.]|uniref:hypothetical protein n=1 Tax=Botrimarina sp. TaxID=2795802 RepID=UPI0032EC386F
MFDDPAARHRRKRKSLLTLWLVVATALLLVGLAAHVTFGPNPPIIVSKETTFLTEPLGPDGLPDYAAALNAHYGKGVTPENNAVVPFLRAVWPKEPEPEWGMSIAEAESLARAIGVTGDPLPMTPLDTPQRRLEVVELLRGLIRDGTLKKAKPGDWLGSAAADNAEFLKTPAAIAAKDPRVEQLIFACDPVKRPFTATQLPFVAAWLEENEDPIDLIVEATNRSRWFAPMLSEGGGFEAFLEFEMSLFQEQRNAANTLQTRSNLALGEGRHADAARDALAIVRLAALGAEGPFWINQFVAVAIGGVALDQIDHVAAHASATEESLRRLLQNLQATGPAMRIAEATDRGERYFGLSMIIACSGGDLDLGLDEAPLALAGTSVDWNPTLRAVNHCCDELVAATRLPTTRRRLAAAERIDQRLGAAEFNLRDWRLLTPSGRGAMVAPVLSASSFGGAQAIMMAGERISVRRRLTETGVALAVYRAANGEYPEKLDALVPGILDTVPADPFGSGPLVYRRTPGGYLLYSVGRNGIDDGGSLEAQTWWGQSTYDGVPVDDVGEPHYDPADPSKAFPADAAVDIPEGADDMSLRVPLPVEPWPWEQW